ncbi:endonuclease/exonuclease/phosphatase family protein [Sphaerisporangium rubeum]|uniref:Endonuclease/exonuclease/phosphatase (EEP) superfamily protein YafD n=1 Tax=Sphaerisporangium rubeum TaxID=321317 RepID=A0A7X0M685_9ACTN|nr:endonuclease/exonuclease/phosphatase (EEP) superfamily protein YafD [Sphaerisporangium rubeum]
MIDKPAHGRRWVTVLVWVALLPFATWAVLRLLGWDLGLYWIQLVAFTPFAAAVSAVVPVTALVLRRRPALVASALVTTVLTACVLPRALADGNPPAAGRDLRVMAANLAVGAASAPDIVRLVRQLTPDVLTIQELTPSAVTGLRQAGLEDLLPYRTGRPANGPWGSGIYARHPLTAGSVIEHGNFRQAETVVKMPGGPEVYIASVHPCAPRYAYKVPCWSQGLRALPPATPRGTVRVLAGDFNATLDHGALRRLLATGYRDAADVTGRGLSPTWPAKGWKPVPGVTLDHILTDPRVAVRDYSTHLVPKTDHRAVFAHLTLP